MRDVLPSLHQSYNPSRGGGDRIRTYSAVKQQIYSLPRLSNFGAPPYSNFWTIFSNPMQFQAFSRSVTPEKASKSKLNEPVEGLEPPTS